MTSNLRRLVERLLRDRTLRRQLPDDFGKAPLMMSSAGGLGALFKPMDKFDPVLLRQVKELVKPGSTVWDVGANVGLFSVAAAARAGASGEVFSFEPDIVLVSLLRKTARMQKPSAAPMTIIPIAIAANGGVRSLTVSQRARASNALSEYGNSQAGAAAEVQKVMTVPIDTLATWLPKPDVLKIDVEGAELEVLSGARKALAETRPVIICEVAQRNAAEAAGLLMASHYVLLDGEKPLRREAVLSGSAPWSTVAVPREMLDRVLPD